MPNFHLHLGCTDERNQARSLPHTANCVTGETDISQTVTPWRCVCRRSRGSWYSVPLPGVLFSSLSPPCWSPSFLQLALQPRHPAMGSGTAQCLPFQELTLLCSQRLDCRDQVCLIHHRILGVTAGENKVEGGGKKEGREGGRKDRRGKGRERRREGEIGGERKNKGRNGEKGKKLGPLLKYQMHPQRSYALLSSWAEV